MKCINCGIEDFYDIIDHNQTRKISGHYIKCKECGTKMFLAVNGEVYDTKNNQMTQGRFLQEQRIQEQEDTRQKPYKRNINNRGSYYSNKSINNNKSRIRSFSDGYKGSTNG